nr:VRR-NUC domain-containing protein [uncultured Capnocytophaga sp.]
MKHQESTLQAACVRWFRYQYPELIIYAVPNGGSRNMREAQRLKSEGVLAGVADLVAMLPNGKSLYIEMKIKGNRQTVSQKDFQKKAIALGYTYAVCHTFEEFQKVVENYISISEYFAPKIKGLKN